MNEIIFCGGHNGSTFPPSRSEIAVFQKTDSGYGMLPLPRPDGWDTSDATDQYSIGYSVYCKNVKQDEATIYSSKLDYEETIPIDDIMYEYEFKSAGSEPVGGNAWKVGVSDYKANPALVLYIDIGFKYYNRDLAVCLTWQNGEFKPVYMALED